MRYNFCDVSKLSNTASILNLKQKIVLRYFSVPKSKISVSHEINLELLFANGKISFVSC